MKNDSRGRRTSARRNAVHVDRVVCDDRRLTVLMNESQLDIKKKECLEEYHWRFCHVKRLRKNDAETAE